MSIQINQIKIEKETFNLLINEILNEILLQIKKNRNLLDNYNTYNWNINKFRKHLSSFDNVKEEEEIIHSLIFKCCEIINVIYVKNIVDEIEIINHISSSSSDIISSDYILIIIYQIKERELKFKDCYNMIYYKESFKLNSLNWKIQSLLTSKDENFYPKKFSNIEFSLSNIENNSDANINMTFLPKDIKNLNNEIKKIKDSLYLIKTTNL